jgi:hypothetical protein
MSAHQLTLIGWGLAILAAAVIGIGAFGMVMGNRSYHGPSEMAHRREKIANLVGAVLLLLGFALQLWAAIVRR